MLRGKASGGGDRGRPADQPDAERIRATGAPAIQINTGKGCHLDAHMVGHAMERCDLPDDSLLMIENVGNLVCPAAFDLGEAHKVVILSVTEGEDKPLKYPDMFAPRPDAAEQVRPAAVAPAFEPPDRAPSTSPG
jgi:hydrogenase nickel incorporation protein HypB